MFHNSGCSLQSKLHQREGLKPHQGGCILTRRETAGMNSRVHRCIMYKRQMFTPVFRVTMTLVNITMSRTDSFTWTKCSSLHRGTVIKLLQTNTMKPRCFGEEKQFSPRTVEALCKALAGQCTVADPEGVPWNLHLKGCLRKYYAQSFYLHHAHTSTHFS